MNVFGQQCAKCSEIIWSRAGHDYKTCTCGTTSVDGGQSEFGSRVGYMPGFEPIGVQLFVIGLTQKEHYQDWNLSRRQGYDILGRIKRGTVDLRQQVVSIGGVRLDRERRTDSDDDGEVRNSEVPEGTNS